MKFEEALPLLRVGKKITRNNDLFKELMGYIYIHENKGLLDRDSDVYELDVKDMLAEDWEEFKEEGSEFDFNATPVCDVINFKGYVSNANDMPEETFVYYHDAQILERRARRAEYALYSEVRNALFKKVEANNDQKQ